MLGTLNILRETFDAACWCFIGYSASQIVGLQKSRKELADLDAFMIDELTRLKRRVDFQLRAKGCEGLAEEEAE